MTIDRDAYEKLAASIEEHLEKLRTERARFREVMDGVDVEEGPEDWQIEETVANRLHNFYMGSEQIFRRIAKLIDGGVPSGERWHKDLLGQMKASRGARPPVIDKEIHSDLLDFLRFRHFYREGYLVDVEWNEMSGLVEDYEEVFAAAVDAIEQFLADLEP